MILDLYARKVIAARLSVRNKSSLVCQTFCEAFQARGRPSELMFHSDQGRQYTSIKFRTLLAMRGVAQSFSAPGVPYDNAPMESFFAHLKTEEFHRFRYRGIIDLTASLRDYIDFYNTKRPHSSIGNMTPDQAEANYYKEKSAAKDIGCAPFA